MASPLLAKAFLFNLNYCILSKDIKLQIAVVLLLKSWIISIYQ
jgi:hypothetical protein